DLGALSSLFPSTASFISRLACPQACCPVWRGGCHHRIGCDTGLTYAGSYRQVKPLSAGPVRCKVLRLAIPVLHVRHAAAAEACYCGRLGFERAYAYRPFEGQDDPCNMGLARDGVWLHLSSFPGDGVPGGVVNLYVDDVDALYAELQSKGVTPAMEP